MLPDYILAIGRDLQESLMPNACTILVAGTSVISATGNRITPYTPAAYDGDNSIPCRIMPGAGKEWAKLASVIMDLEVWTVTIPSGTSVKALDRIAILDHTPPILDIEGISDGGSYETAISLLCTKAS